jgi:hypothetical protein
MASDTIFSLIILSLGVGTQLALKKLNHKSFLCVDHVSVVFSLNRYLIMQISNVISGLADPTTWGKKGETAVQTGVSAIKSSEQQNQTNPTAQKATAEILRQYDVTHITPEAFSQMIQKLYKAGALSEKDYQELLAVRTDLQNAGVEPNETVNLLEHYSDKVSKAQKSMGTTLDDASQQQSLGPDMHRLDWMQKFAMIQANPDAVGLDMAA